MARAHLLEIVSDLVARSHDSASLSNDDLVAAIDLVGRARRSIDSIGAELAALLDSRSSVPETSLARAMGDRSAAIAISRLTGIDPAEAHDWIAAGSATESRVSITGELLPPRYKAVAASLASGAISPRAARTIVETLDAAAPHCGADDLAELEMLLLEYAPRLTSRELAKLCRQAIDRLDADGAEPREDDLRARAGISVVRGRDGMITWIVKMHPEASGLITTAVDARTAPRRQPTFDEDPAVVDGRSLRQKRLDALVDIASESLARDNGRLAGTAVTMNVTVPLEALVSGLGVAHIDGIDAPISARTARRLAVNAAIIPIVLGGDSEPLDVGRASRLFTEPQRRALAVRDGGCIWPGCDAPPGWCEVAHIVPWSHGGPTDIANGALMCPFHHRRFDNDGWMLQHHDGIPWLIPPAWLDATRAPRRAGRLPRAA